MSELSTVAIKDGHRGHIHHHGTPSHPNPLDAERADRISRLAGLERVTAARHPNNPYYQNPPGSSSGAYGAGGASAQQTASQQPAAYFDNAGNPQILREKSTVGSASATGSVGGRTTWASGSEVDPDRMSEQGYSAAGGDLDMDTSSVGGMSNNTEGVSEADNLVAFGEGARTPARTRSPGVVKAMPGPGGHVPSHLREASGVSGSPASSATGQAESSEARMLDGVTYDRNVLDTAVRTPPLVGGQGGASGSGEAERIIGGRIEGGGTLGTPEEMEGGARGLGRFEFERK